MCNSFVVYFQIFKTFGYKKLKNSERIRRKPRQSASLRSTGPSHISTLSAGTGAASGLIPLWDWTGTMWCKLKNVLLDFFITMLLITKMSNFVG